MSFKRGSGGGSGGGELAARGKVPKKWTFLLCLGSFCAGMLFTNRCRFPLFSSFVPISSINEKPESKDILNRVSNTQEVIQ
ncbi:hypothetical protein GW17_00045090 [Ensete ventricosum]|nr:hypothetical protein GW17_00045090 [Ensete ventricosum]